MNECVRERAGEGRVSRQIHAAVRNKSGHPLAASRGVLLGAGFINSIFQEEAG